MSRYDSIRFDEEATEKSRAFKLMFENLDKAITLTVCAGNAKSLVYTKLQEAHMWLNKAIRDEQELMRSAELQEQRGHM